MTLFDDRYPAYTRSIGFLAADISTVLAAQDRWWIERDGFHVRSRPDERPFEAILASGFDDWLLVGCDGPWTALIGKDLRDSIGPPSVLGRYGGFDDVIVRRIPGTMVSLIVEKGGLAERTIMAYEDGGNWAFHQKGIPYPFEKTDTYASRRTRDRFTPEMLDEYCLNLGIRINDASFFSGDKVRFSPEAITSVISRRTRTILKNFLRG